MLVGKDWLTEVCEEGGSAFAMKLIEKVHDEQTPYQHIEVFETERFGTVMVIDGFVMLTDRDNFIYHEMMTHPALFSHTGPRRVVIVGGGDCGSLQEVLRHPDVESVVQVEIDERVTRVAEAYFPDLCRANGDPRVEFRFEDGIRWVQEAPPGDVDVIIVDSTDPIGPAEGLFREPFYRACYRVLGPGGILVQQSESPLYHLELIRTMHGAMGAAGFHETRLLGFPQCSYPSGWWSATLAFRDRPQGTSHGVTPRNRGFATRYYNAEIHRAAFAVPEFVAAVL